MAKFTFSFQRNAILVAIYICSHGHETIRFEYQLIYFTCQWMTVQCQYTTQRTFEFVSFYLNFIVRNVCCHFWRFRTEFWWPNSLENEIFKHFKNITLGIIEIPLLKINGNSCWLENGFIVSFITVYIIAM